ncbi:MAG: hypothetical protein M1377_03835, partial [Deltaproteobacteria bacterium]|nr:hypothetical protein [Deltaproteobacteria bacterium]
INLDPMGTSMLKEEPKNCCVGPSPLSRQETEPITRDGPDDRLKVLEITSGHRGILYQIRRGRTGIMTRCIASSVRSK